MNLAATRSSKYAFYLAAGTVLDLPIFRFFNRAVRLGYLYILVPFLALYLRRDKSEVKIAVRHSVKSGADFNPFFSDIDLLATIKTENDLVIRNLLQRYDKARKILPFIGELEIFTAAEKDRFASLRSRHLEFFALVRDVRKISWQLEELGIERSPYHHVKITRALENLKARHGVQRTLPVSEFLHELGVKISRALNDAVGWRNLASLKIVEIKKSNHLRWHPIHDLGMDISHAWLLTAVLPSEIDLRDEALLSLLRSRPNILELFHVYAEAEALQIRAVYRARAAEFAWMRQWSEELMKQSRWRPAILAENLSLDI